MSYKYYDNFPKELSVTHYAYLDCNGKADDGDFDFVKDLDQAAQENDVVAVGVYRLVKIIRLKNTTTRVNEVVGEESCPEQGKDQ